MIVWKATGLAAVTFVLCSCEQHAAVSTAPTSEPALALRHDPPTQQDGDNGKKPKQQPL